jgi:hypothetical protein
MHVQGVAHALLWLRFRRGQRGLHRQDSMWSIEVFRPPYFFSGWGRPRLQSVPSIPLKHGEQFTITATLYTGTENPFRVALIAPDSVTHTFDFNQRYIVLEEVFVEQPQGPAGTATIRVFVPPDTVSSSTCNGQVSARMAPS